MKIIWHGEPCPQEHLARVEAELGGMLGRMLDSPQQLISHSIFLDNGAAITAWGETGDDAFHAEFHESPTRERADKALFDRIQQLQEPSNFLDNVEGSSKRKKKMTAKAKKTPAKKAKSLATPKPHEPLTYNPDHGSDNLILEAILDCYRQLAPENLDGEATHIGRTIADSKRKLRGLLAAFGREVSEDEIFWWEEQKHKYEYERNQQDRVHKGKKAAVRRDKDDSV